MHFEISQKIGGDVSTKRGQPSAPGFVVLHRPPNGHWELFGQVPRRRGLTARAARTQAIVDATEGAAKAGEVYAAVLRSEWLIAMDWTPPEH